MAWTPHLVPQPPVVEIHDNTDILGPHPGPQLVVAADLGALKVEENITYEDIY